jgi:hypothetical protein
MRSSYSVSVFFSYNRFFDSSIDGTNDIVISAFGQQSSLPQLNDRALQVELVMEELLFPTSMIFLDNNTLLITQKNKGDVISIINGSVKSQPVINVKFDTLILNGTKAPISIDTFDYGNTN